MRGDAVLNFLTLPLTCFGDTTVGTVVNLLIHNSAPSLVCITSLKHFNTGFSKIRDLINLQ